MLYYTYSPPPNYLLKGSLFLTIDTYVPPQEGIKIDEINDTRGLYFGIPNNIPSHVRNIIIKCVNGRFLSKSETLLGFWITPQIQNLLDAGAMGIYEFSWNYEESRLNNLY